MHSRKAARGKSSWGEKCVSEARTLRRVAADLWRYLQLRQRRGPDAVALVPVACRSRS